MPGPRSIPAKTAAALPAVAEAVKDFRFPLASVRVDERTRTLVIPYEKKHPRPESWELVVRGARSLAVTGRLEQATDYFGSLRHDAAAGVFEIEGLLVTVRVKIDSLDVEVRCLTAEAVSTFDVADLPKEFRREMEARETASLKDREQYAKADRERYVVVTAVGAVAALVLGAGSGMPPWMLPLEAAAGGGAGWILAHRRIEFVAGGAAIFGGPTVSLSVLGVLLTKGTSEKPTAAALHAFFWSLLAVTGLLLAHLNGNLMAQVQGMTARWESEAAPPKPLDHRIPWRAAGIVGLGSACLYLVFHAPWIVWAVGAPLGSGGTAWLLARFQARPSIAARILGSAGVVVALMAIDGGAFVPAALLLAAAHLPAGMMVAYYSRGEGPR